MSSDPAIACMILRGKVQTSAIEGRTLNQSTVLDEDVRDLVELLHPFGYWAVPVQGADVLELQIGGYASHKVQLGGDLTSDVPTDGQPGECGFSRAGQQFSLRLTGTESISPLLQWGMSRAELKRLVQEEFVALFNAHVHSGVQSGTGDSGPPTTPMTAAHLTGGT